MDKIVKPQNPLGRIIVVTPWQLSMHEILFVMLMLELPKYMYQHICLYIYYCECQVSGEDPQAFKLKLSVTMFYSSPYWCDCVFGQDIFAD